MGTPGKSGTPRDEFKIVLVVVGPSWEEKKLVLERQERAPKPPRILKLWSSAGGFCGTFCIVAKPAEEPSHRTPKVLQNFGSQTQRKIRWGNVDFRCIIRTGFRFSLTTLPLKKQF